MPTIETRPGNVTVDLPEPSTAGFRWTLIQRPPEVTLVSDERLGGGDTPHVVGGSHLRRFTLAVAAPGTYELTFELRRSWESGEARRETVRLVVAAPPASP